MRTVRWLHISDLHIQEAENAPRQAVLSEMLDEISRRSKTGVSIRSPYRSKGEISWPQSWCPGPLGFNPLPLPKQGEMRFLDSSCLPLPEFQSAPLTEARGDFGPARDIPALEGVSIRSPYRSKGRFQSPPRPAPPDRVSIRSPYRSKGRLLRSCRSAGMPGFQSAPLTEARGDILGWWANASSFQFQSAPLTEARGDATNACGTVRQSVFQSAPLTEARGDLTELGGIASAFAFQSAPLTEARGDVVSSAGKTRLIRVSIRSPYRSKGRYENKGGPKDA